MNFIGKNSEAYNCFANFKKDDNAKEYRQFVDIFLPMLFQENSNRLEISVGKKQSESQFLSWLSMVTNRFNVIPSMYGEYPKLTIKDCINHSTIVSLNLAIIKDLCIETKEAVGFFIHNICFNYNKIDYRMHIIVNK